MSESAFDEMYKEMQEIGEKIKKSNFKIADKQPADEDPADRLRAKCFYEAEKQFKIQVCERQYIYGLMFDKFIAYSKELASLPGVEVSETKVVPDYSAVPQCVNIFTEFCQDYKGTAVKGVLTYSICADVFHTTCQYPRVIMNVQVGNPNTSCCTKFDMFFDKNSKIEHFEKEYNTELENAAVRIRHY